MNFSIDFEVTEDFTAGLFGYLVFTERFEHLGDATLFLLHVGMNVEVERG